MKIKPRSRLGRWAVRFAGVFLVLLVLLILFAEWLDLIPDPIVNVLGAAAVLSGSVAFFPGVVAMLKDRDYSPLVILATGLGLIIIAYSVMKIPFGA